jgi:hypothetical protein
MRSAVHIAHGDALALSALTNLTRLNLSGMRAGVGDLAASALACSLKQLRHLDLTDCNLGSLACVPPMAQLVHLTQLQLCGNVEVTQQGLMLLTKLSNLQQLEFERAPEVTDDVVAKIWAAV